MLNWAVTFFVVAIIAAVLGFTNIAGSAIGIAKILFLLFLGDECQHSFYSDQRGKAAGFKFC